MSCTIYFVRHGETDWNVAGKIQGHSDIPLNDVGVSQAEQLHDELKEVPFEVAYSSDLIRAVKTAEIILKDRKITLEKSFQLRERNSGVWESKFTKDFLAYVDQHNLTPDRESKESFLSWDYDGSMESYDNIYERVSRYIKENAISNLGKTILCTVHGGVIGSILYNLDFQPQREWKVSNCAYIVAKVNESGEMSIQRHKNIVCSEVSKSH